MPSNVAAASPVGALPESLSAGFVRDREIAARINLYPDGTPEVGLMVSAERSRWQLAKSLAPAAMETLRQFYLSHHGAHVPFWFTDPEDGQTYAARFEGPFSLAFGRGRSGVTLQIVEVA